MSQKNSANLPSIDAWQVENLRLTAFPSPSAEIPELLTWWADVVGKVPETSISQQRKRSWQQKGDIENKELVLKVELNRINWLLIASKEKVEAKEDLMIGPLPELLNEFLPLMFRWFELETCPLVRWLAFGAVLLQPIKSRAEGHRQISKYLPSVTLDTEGSSDFLYQINRPRSSRSSVITDLKINRLSKWSVASWRNIELSMTVESPASYIIGQKYFTCRVELDINTTADFRGEISPRQLTEIFQELVDLGQEIVREGDLP